MLVPCEQAAYGGEHDWLMIRLCTAVHHTAVGCLTPSTHVQQVRWILHPDLFGFLPLRLTLTLSALLATTELQRSYEVGEAAEPMSRSTPSRVLQCSI